MPKNPSIKKNFVLNAILTISNILFPIISYPYVARILGPSGTGEVDFAASIISYFSLFAQLGIPTYGIRACAKVRDNKLELSRTVWELMSINIVMSLIAYMVFIPVLFFVPQISSEKPLFIIVSITLFLNALGIEHLYRGLEQYSYITIRSIVFKFIAFIAMFLLIKQKEDYVIYGAITIFAGSASNILNFIHARKIIGFKNIGKLNWKRHMSPIVLFFAMNCATTIYLNLDTSMLGFIASKKDVGYYGAAVKVKKIMVSLVTSLGVVLLPRASYYVEQGRMDEFRNITHKALKFVFVISAPLMVFFMCFAKESVLFLSGISYSAAVPAMVVIMPTLLFIGITNILGIQVLVPLGKEKYVLYSEIAGAIIDLILNAIFIPKLKSTGAAIGTVVAELVVLIVQYILLFKIRDKNPIVDSFKKIKYWKMLIAISLAIPASIWVKYAGIKVAFGSTINRMLMTHNLCLLAIEGVCFFLTYGIIMIILKDDMILEILNTVIGKAKSIAARKGLKRS
ncbi:MAG: oligosaccharide flippase family protein [Clostridiales bacterium]|nr:oligosaccharide flippase family protein [Clostridiales bacterium]